MSEQPGASVLEHIAMDVDLDAEIVCWPHSVHDNVEHPADILIRSVCPSCQTSNGPTAMCWAFHHRMGLPAVRLRCNTCGGTWSRDEVIRIVKVLR